MKPNRFASVHGTALHYPLNAAQLSQSVRAQELFLLAKMNVWPQRTAERYVLVVEDDPQLRSVYGLALRAAGFAVVAVDDGLTALRHVEEEIPAAVVLDLNLPRVSGLDVEQELRTSRVTERVPVIVVTGETAHLDREQFSCVLQKPFDTEQLVAAVRRCLAEANSDLLR